MSRDPCVVLGVTREAGPAAWKKAYRRLAMRWHPDRNDDPQATERFKEINAAYEALLAVDSADEEIPDPGPSTAAPAEERPRAADIRMSLSMTLAEAARGGRRSIEFLRHADCPVCAGSGESGLARTRFCSDCHGSGRVHDAHRRLVACRACAGKGLFTERICPHCAGAGKLASTVQLDITVPPGMLAGDELRLAGQGEAGDAERAPGDLFLTVLLAPHSVFRLDGRDLHCRMPVDALLLLAGGDIDLPGLFGPMAHSLPGGLPELQEIRLAGHGYPGRGKYAAGDLCVTLTPEFPRALDARQRNVLRRLHAECMAEAERCLPGVAAWRDELGSA